MIAANDMNQVRFIMKRSGFSNISESENVVFFNKPDVPIQLDFLQVDDETMKALLADAVPMVYGGQSLKVPSLHNRIAMKLLALQSGPSKPWEQDLLDIPHLAVENKLSPEKRLKPLCERYAPPEIYTKLVRRIEALKND